LLLNLNRKLTDLEAVMFRTKLCHAGTRRPTTAMLSTLLQHYNYMSTVM